MAQRVIHVLELIEVDAQHGDQPAAFRGLGQGFRERVEEKSAIRQACQGVVTSQMLQSFLDFLALRDVAQHADNDPVRAVTLGLPMHFNRQQGAFLAPYLDLRQLVRAAAGDEGVVLALQLSWRGRHYPVRAHFV